MIKEDYYYSEGTSLLMAQAAELSKAIDKCFGEGYSKHHPEVLSSWLNSWSTLQLANALYAQCRLTLP